MDRSGRRSTGCRWPGVLLGLYPRSRPHCADRLAGTRGLTSPMMCYSPDFTKLDAAARAREVEAARHAIAVTAALGGKLCRVLSGQNRPELTRTDGIRYAAECIIALLPDAEQHGVTLILEN